MNGQDKSKKFNGGTQESGSTDPVGSVITPCASNRETKVWVRISLRDYAFRPLKNKDYKLEVNGVVYKGNTGERGWVEEKVPESARTGTLTVWLDGADEEPIRWELKIGEMDPVGVVTGAQARLNNMGFHCGKVDGKLGPRTEAALKGFQESMGLEPTGKLDPETQKKLDQGYNPNENILKPQDPFLK